MSGLSALSSITIALTSIPDIPVTISDTSILSFDVPTLTSDVSTASSVLVPPPTFIPVHGFQSGLSGLTVDPSTIPVTSAHPVQVTPSQSTFLSSTGPSPASGTPTAVLASDNASTASSSSSFESSSPSLLVASDTKTSLSSASAPPSSSTSSIAMTTSHSKNTIIGGVVGGVVGLLVITAILMYYLIRRSRQGKKPGSAHVTPFEVSPDTNIEPMPQPKLQVGPHPPAPTPEISATSSSSVSDSNTTYFIPIETHHKIEETADQSSLGTTISQRDSLIDQSIPDSNLSSTELMQTTPPVTHNTSNPNPLLWDIVNAASQDCHQGFSDPGDANISQNFRTTITHRPSDTDGSVLNDNSNKENRRVHYNRSSPRNSDTDTLSLSTEW